MPKGIYPRKIKSLEEKFWSHVYKTDSCWLWTGTLRLGYGRIRHNNRSISAHRASWEFVNGPIPEGLEILHACDVRECVNPGHLSVGTRSDNMQDMVSKGRASSHLTWEQVREIRKLHGKIETRRLLEKFDLSESGLGRIVRRLAWVNDPLEAQ